MNAILALWVKEEERLCLPNGPGGVLASLTSPLGGGANGGRGSGGGAEVGEKGEKGIDKDSDEEEGGASVGMGRMGRMEPGSGVEPQGRWADGDGGVRFNGSDNGFDSGFNNGFDEERVGGGAKRVRRAKERSVWDPALSAAAGPSSNSG